MVCLPLIVQAVINHQLLLLLVLRQSFEIVEIEPLDLGQLFGQELRVVWELELGSVFLTHLGFKSGDVLHLTEEHALINGHFDFGLVQSLPSVDVSEDVTVANARVCVSTVGPKQSRF